MKDFTVSVKKLTGEELMREACEMTFLGHSRQSLLSIYKSEHSPARTQIFWIRLENIPLFVSTHLIRHHVGSTPFQLSLRPDKGNRKEFKSTVRDLMENLEVNQDRFKNQRSYCEEDEEYYIQTMEELEWIIENTDRETPVNLGLLTNAQSLIDMAKLRLCYQASPETINVFTAIRNYLAENVDPDLAKMMVKKCVYRNGLCGEPRCCGFNSTLKFKDELNKYLINFNNKQKGENENKSIEKRPSTGGI